MARLLFALAFLPVSSPAYRMYKSDVPVTTDALGASNESLTGRGPQVFSLKVSQSAEPLPPIWTDRGAHDGNVDQGEEGIASGFLEMLHRAVAWEARTGPDAAFRAETADGQGDVLMHFPPWAVNLFNFMLRWSPLAFVMCTCTFVCFLATGQKPDHLDYLGVLAHLFMFELVVLILAGATHALVADGNEDKTPHLVAKLSGVTIFGCGTVVNIWWLAWQTLRKTTSESSLLTWRPPEAVEAARLDSSSSAKPFHAAPSRSGGESGGSPVKPADDLSSEGAHEGQTWNTGAFGSTSFGASGGAPFTRPPRGGR